MEDETTGPSAKQKNAGDTDESVNDEEDDFNPTLAAMETEIKPKVLKSSNGAEELILKKIDSESCEIKNFEVIKNFKKYNTYKLASQADLIIGKYSTIMLECFAAKKKVLIHDEIFKNYKFFLSEINIIESSFEGLKKRFFEAMERNNYLKEKEWMDFGEKYFFNFKSGINGFQIIKKNIKKIFDENKLLSDRKLN